MKTSPALSIGGGLASGARYLISKLSIFSFEEALFLIGTLLAIVLSSAILALVPVYIGSDYLLGLGVPFLGIGFCGGFSIFFAFNYETFILINEGRFGLPPMF